MEILMINKPSHRRLPYSTTHICPECNNEFTGRENRIFCSADCKVKFNNAKAAEINSLVSEQVKMLKKNAQILDELYTTNGLPFKTKKIDLIKQGFILNSPSRRIKTVDGIEWINIGSYVLRLIEDNTEVQIMSLNDLKDMKYGISVL